MRILCTTHQVKTLVKAGILSGLIAGMPMIAQAVQPAGSESEAAAAVRAETGGQIVDVRGDGNVYRVSVRMPNGVVRTVTVPKRR